MRRAYSIDTESGELTVVGDNLDIGTIGDKFAFLLEVLIFLSGELGETPLVGDDDFLSSGEFEFTSSESFHSMGNILSGTSDGVENLVDLYSAGFTLGLTESTSHTGLESISTSA